MTISFEPTQSRQIFVGRDEEIKQFSNLLETESSRWIVHIPGDGGTGKTCLLEHFHALAKKNQHFLVPEGIVDFYNTTNQTGFGLLQEITSQLGRECFKEFQEERDFFHSNFLNREQEPDPGERQAAVSRVLDAFLNDYRELIKQGRRIVLFFDTCEEMHAIRDWVLNELVAGISKVEKELAEAGPSVGKASLMKTILVFAGRRNLEFPPEQTLLFELTSLSEEDVSEFWGSDDVVRSQLAPEKIKDLYKRSTGRPLYVALVFDWLKNGVSTADDLLSHEEPFNETLVNWVRRLNQPEKQAILCMALAWRRMEPDLLDRLLPVKNGDVQNLINGLRRFSFVKYRPENGGVPASIQLHDEMRDLVNTHVWKSEGKQTKTELSMQVIEWYEKKLDNPALLSGKTLARDDRERALLAEWLFYNLQVNATLGMELHERLFRKAVHNLDLAFCDLLNEEAARFSNCFSDAQSDDLRFRQALTAFRREKYPRAKEIWESLYRRPNISAKLKATILMLLVELEAYTGSLEDADRHAKDGEHLYLSLIETMKKSGDDITKLEEELGQLYNNWGYVSRAKDNPLEAIKKYKKAMDYPGSRKNKARALNNMGYCYFLLRAIDEARSYVGMALNMRRELKIPYEMGLSYNTMGILMEDSARTSDAADLYQKAYEQFDAARSERGRALALMSLGRVERLTNDYQKALDHLGKARTVFEHLGDEENLITVLNELGCMYRERGEGEDLFEAERLLLMSLQKSIQRKRVSQQMDNYEDIAIVHYKMAGKASQQGDENQASLWVQKSREGAERVRNMAYGTGALAFGEKNKAFVVSKAIRLLGDLDYLNQQYEKAFDEYLESCKFLADSILHGGRGSVFLERRYEGAIDRLQEQIHALPDKETQVKYTSLVLEKMEKMPKGVQEALEKVKVYLETTLLAIKMVE